MKILIEDLTFETILGILEHERTTPQKVRIDCEIDYHYRDGAFINYAEAADLIRTVMDREQFELIEDALDTLSATLKQTFPLISTLILTIHKPDILSNCSVGVQNRYVFTS